MKNVWLDYAIKVRLPIILFVVVLTFAATYFLTNPKRQGVGYAPEQPIHYSHELHAGQMKIDCQYCHVGADKSRHAVVPSVDTCMNCHSLARTDRPEIKKLTDYFQSGKPIEWVRVHKLPDFVYFNHSVHVNNGIACQNCHGPVQEMDVMRQVRPLTMANCLGCHSDAHDELAGTMDKAQLDKLKQGPSNCSACHR